MAPDETVDLKDEVADLRKANALLHALMTNRDAEIADLRTRCAALLAEVDRLTPYLDEVARLHARPTEEEVTRIVQDMRHGIRLSSEITQHILALFPKVRP